MMEEAVTLGLLSLFLGLPLPLVGSLHFAARCSLGPAALRALVCRCAALLRQLSLRALCALLDPRALLQIIFLAKKMYFAAYQGPYKLTYVSI